MLKPTDKVSARLASELPGCNVSERQASLVNAKIPVVEAIILGEDSMDYFRLAQGIVHTGGVLAATRQQGHDRNWRSPVCLEEKFSEEGRPYTADTGKGPSGSRMTEWPVVAMKSGNADGGKGPC